VIREGVDRALRHRGLTRSDVEPDFWIDCYLVLEERETAPHATAMTPLYWAAPGSSQYFRGTVVVDFLDPRTRDVFWRGTARTTLTHPENPDPAQVARAVARLMDHVRPFEGRKEARREIQYSPD
jgi:hypothetical protein